jgi:hypothetical protein
MHIFNMEAPGLFFDLKGFRLQTEVDGVLLDRLMHHPTGKKYIIIDPQ